MSLDFTGVTNAVDATTIVLAIAAVAAIKILPGVARWGYDKVIRWFYISNATGFLSDARYYLEQNSSLYRGYLYYKLDKARRKMGDI
jgi:hypothetical protein